MITVLTTDVITGSQYLETRDFMLPLYNLGETVGYYEKDVPDPIEGKIRRIEMSMFKLNGETIIAYQYELSNGEVVDEDRVDYVL